MMTINFIIFISDVHCDKTTAGPHLQFLPFLAAMKLNATPIHIFHLHHNCQPDFIAALEVKQRITLQVCQTQLAAIMHLLFNTGQMRNEPAHLSLCPSTYMPCAHKYYHYILNAEFQGLCTYTFTTNILSKEGVCASAQ